MTTNLQQPIGELGTVKGWKSLPIKECKEPLVPLGSFSDFPMIATDAIYAGERKSSPYSNGELKHALYTAFVREGIAKRLVQAASLLPAGHMLLVWDAYRPPEVQQVLFDSYVNKLIDTGMPRGQAHEDAQHFVSIPTNNPLCPPPHNTGGAVDLTIIHFSAEDWGHMERLTRTVRQPETTENWKEIYTAEMERQKLIHRSVPLPMGTVFDAVEPETATCYFENLDDTALTTGQIDVRDNRRLLWNVMMAAGFSNYPAEWWHFDFGNQFHAARTDQPVIYGAAALSVENQAWEQLRCNHYAGSVAIAEGTRHTGENKLGRAMTHPETRFVANVTRRTGNLRNTTHPQANAL